MEQQQTLSQYWNSLPINRRIPIQALVIGLLAIYIPMAIVAVFGVWRNNLLRIDTNWPWAFPLALFNLAELKFKKTGLIHGFIFIPMLCWITLGVTALYAGRPLSELWYVPFVMISIPVINCIAFQVGVVGPIKLRQQGS